MSRSAKGLLLAFTLVSTAGLGACGGSNDSGDGPSGAATPTEATYVAPATEPGEDGWEIYPVAAMVDAEAARYLNPIPDSPEAAVVKFLASRVRGDDVWKGAVVSSPDDRARRALEEWDEWSLDRFQLRGRKSSGADSFFLRTYFEISVDGDTDEGEDEFEVVREGGGWRVTSPPT